MINRKLALTGALMLGVSVVATQALAQTTPPDPPKFEAQQSPTFVGISDLYEYKALPEYHEPAWVTAKFVDAGKLPPVAERLPKEPLVFKTATMPDGVGVYGDTMRHVIGGKLQGWNFLAGAQQGWGGIDLGMYECLTRTGPLFTIKAEELQPLPNLAKSWEWSDDGFKLTMHLVEGAKWSDGVPFTSADIMFLWEDNIVDPNYDRHGRHDGGNLRRRHPARRARRLHHRMDVHTAFCHRLSLPDGRPHVPEPHAYPQAAASQVQFGCHV